MAAVLVKPGIFWIGVNDRTTDLFEGIWPIHNEGVTYNSYLIKDKRNAIIDLAKAFKSDVFFDHIQEVINIEDIDYVIINHMEPDHTGVLKTLKKMAPRMQILATPKAVKMLGDFYGITEHIHEVKDGEILDLGENRLEFIHAPFVHWPETMVTYNQTRKILFSCDAFGGYGALRGSIFDDECHDIDFYIKEALRYYVNIVAKFTQPVLNAIEKLKSKEINIIAPSHGLVWRRQPQRILDLYRKWSLYGKQPAEPGVTLIYGSMYGNTEMMMNAVAQGVSDAGIALDIFDVARTHASYILPSLWTKTGVIIGAPTYEVSLFPPMKQLLEMAELKKITSKTAAYFGSFGWSGGALKEVKRIVEPLNWELKQLYEFPGGPTREDLKNGRELGAQFAGLITAT